MSESTECNAPKHGASGNAPALREGFTTGTAATAAACAAFDSLLGGEFLPFRSVPLPPFPPLADAHAPLSFSACEQTAVSHAMTVFSCHKQGEVIPPSPTETIRLNVPIAEVKLLGNSIAEASVIKDGGDDPDVTHGARITATVELAPRPAHSAYMPTPDALPEALPNDPAGDLPDGPAEVLPAPFPADSSSTCLTAAAMKAHEKPVPRTIQLPGALAIELRAGEGVGTVTLPGLPVPVGDPAINPAPRRQLAVALAEIAAMRNYEGGLRVTLCIAHGEELARRTLNPRLGIVGGLSILGTHGTVRPYSHEAWKASIEEGLCVARALKCDAIVLSTGRRSERLLQGLYPALPVQAFVQAADFAAFSLESAARQGFSRLVWGCFFGKLVKLAQGLPYTHAHAAPLDWELLADWCAEAGMEHDETRALARCATAGQALDIILKHPYSADVLRALALRGRKAARHFIGNDGPDLTLHLFHLDGKELARV